MPGLDISLGQAQMGQPKIGGENKCYQDKLF